MAKRKKKRSKLPRTGFTRPRKMGFAEVQQELEKAEANESWDVVLFYDNAIDAMNDKGMDGRYVRLKAIRDGAPG